MAPELLPFEIIKKISNTFPRSLSFPSFKSLSEIIHKNSVAWGDVRGEGDGVSGSSGRRLSFITPSLSPLLQLLQNSYIP